jgi:hypothetical protein
MKPYLPMDTQLCSLDVLDSLAVATTPDQWVGRRRQTLSVGKFVLTIHARYPNILDNAAPLKQLAESAKVPVVHIPEDKNQFSHWIVSNFGFCR